MYPALQQCKLYSFLATENSVLDQWNRVGSSSVRSTGYEQRPLWIIVTCRVGYPYGNDNFFHTSEGSIDLYLFKAFDLGLNCDSSGWKMHGHDLFSPEETQTRRQIWWACTLTDRWVPFRYPCQLVLNFSTQIWIRLYGFVVSFVSLICLKL